MTLDHFTVPARPTSGGSRVGSIGTALLEGTAMTTNLTRLAREVAWGLTLTLPLVAFLTAAFL